MIGSDFERYSGRTNVSTEIKPWFSMGINSTFSLAKQNTPVGGGGGASPLTNGIFLPNAVPVYDLDENFQMQYDENGKPLYNFKNPIFQDADRIERELNEDPKLIGIGASDDLFGKIVEELKTKGIWEGDKETNVDERPEPAQEEQQKPAVYDMLSEADREALAFGYQMQKKEQERKEKRKKRNRRLKHVSAAVVALVFVGGIGFSTEASRRWIFQVGDVFLDSLGISIKNNFTEKEKKYKKCK